MSHFHIILSNCGILDSSKLKGFADEKLKLAQMINFVLDREENIVGKGANAGYQPFLLFLYCFQKPSSGPLIVGILQ